jgi:hypothetical protein
VAVHANQLHHGLGLDGVKEPLQQSKSRAKAYNARHCC